MYISPRVWDPLVSAAADNQLNHLHQLALLQLDRHLLAHQLALLQLDHQLADRRERVGMEVVQGAKQRRPIGERRAIYDQSTRTILRI